MKINSLRNHDKKYNLIYADPPWSFDNKRTGGSTTSGASQKYNTMEVHELCGLPVNEITADDCVLLLWWVASMPKEALLIVDDWGFTLKTMTAFVWNKVYKKSGLPFFGMGYWTRAGSESCLIAVKGNPKPASHSVRSVRTAPVLRHSEKPSEFADDAVGLCGDVPRIELFARDQKTGWDSFGDEL